MKFEEIFKNPGIYTHKYMNDGAAARIDEIGSIDFVLYKDENQIEPDLLEIRVYKECFERNWQKALTRHQLFGTKRHDLLNERTT